MAHNATRARLRFDDIVSRTEATTEGPGNQHRRRCERFARHTRPRRSAQDVDAFEHIPQRANVRS
jgi:hypothetical protein